MNAAFDKKSRGYLPAVTLENYGVSCYNLPCSLQIKVPRGIGLETLLILPL